MAVLLLLGLFVSPMMTRADNDDLGNASGTFLKLDPSAESAGFGSAFTGTSGPLAAYFNPAGLGTVDRTQTVLSENDIFADITYRYLSVTSPVEQLGGGLGLNLTSIDYGSQNRTRINNNDPITGLGDFAAGDMAIGATYGQELAESLFVGGGLKYVQSEIGDYRDGTFTGDLGLQFDPDVKGLRFGLSGRNLFGELQLNQKKDPLPGTLEFGVQYNMPLVPGAHELDFGLGAGFAQGADEYSLIGMSYNLYQSFSLRVGRNGTQDADNGFTAGFGMTYRGFGFDYAYVPFGELGYQQRFTINYSFGGSSRRQATERSMGLTKQKKPSDQAVRDLESDLERINRLYQSEKYREAYGILRELEKDYPDNPEVLIWLARVEHKLGDLESARKRLAQVTQLEPANDSVRKLSREFNKNGSNRSASSPDTGLTQAREFFRREEFDKARTALLEIVDREPRSVQALYWLGRTEYRLGLRNQARRRMLTVLDLDPNNERARQFFFEIN
ncbi:MAG: PorV/PorQ family protein [bacterium]